VTPAIQQLSVKITASLCNQFEKDVFAAALTSLALTGNPLRLNNFATNLREISGILFERLSPDQSVQNSSWYVPTTNQNGQSIITRADRITFAVQAGLSDTFVQNSLGVDVQTMRQSLVAIVNTLSKYTHIRPAVFGANTTTTETVALEALEAFAALFDTIAECRAEVEHAAEGNLNEALMAEFLKEAVAELDELSTHHCVEGVLIESVRVKSMDDTTIVYVAEGFVEGEFQYSSSDVSRGDGLVTHDSYPLRCEFTADIASPLDVTADRRTLAVNNDSFYE
jgi:Predicted pPIWI-associating nuclease